MAYQINNPFQTYLDLSGRPANGVMYIGTINTNPEIAANRIQVYWDKEATQPASQPISIIGGYPVRNGSPAQLFSSTNHSCTVRTNQGALIFYRKESPYNNFIDDLSGYNGASMVGYGSTTVEKSLRKNVKKYGATGDGTTNDTSAFTAARSATGGNYYIPEGVYVVDASPDVWADAFTAGDNAYLKISGVTYNVSNAFCGAQRYVQASFQKTNIVHAKTGNIVMYFQDGGPGTATGFYRGLAVTTNSHWIQVQPATNGGSVDLLWQRSTLNADPGGNRFNETFEESIDRLIFSFATTASGSPAFDSYMQVIAGLTPSLVFPAIAADFKQGWIVQTRALGALRYALVPTSATEATYSDLTSGNILGKVKRSRTTLAGIAFDSMYDTPTGISEPIKWGSVFSDLPASGGTLPATVNVWDTAGSTRNIAIGTLKVAAQPSAAAGSYRESRFTFDGAAVTITDIANTLPGSITATLIVSGGKLQFSGAYSGGLGSGITLSVSVEFCAAGR